MNHNNAANHKLKEWIRKKTSREDRRTIRLFLTEIIGFFVSRNLRLLATLFDTDKWGVHWYARHYQTHFQHLRRRQITILEIGVGGYEDPLAGGGSLRMWRRFFPKAQVVGLDYFDKSPHAGRRIRIYRGDQSDQEFLLRMIDEVGRPDLIIDDGSHINSHVIKSFQVLFPLLADDGIYVVEDTQTSYWPKYGGSSDDLLHAPTSMCLLKDLVDCMNYEEFIKPGYTPSYYDKNIVAMHFYHNLAFIQKGQNNEGSNTVKNNTHG